VDVAAGRAAAELVIRNGRWVNVLTREVVAGIDIAVCCGRSACIAEDAGYCVGADTRATMRAGKTVGGHLLAPHPVPHTSS
jgi:adenine deaminase